MSERKRRGVPVEDVRATPDGPRRVVGVKPSWNSISDTPILGLEGPKRWRVSVVSTVFEGYAFLTDKEAMSLQDKLKQRKDVFGNVFLRAEQGQQPSDYTTVDSVIHYIELAVR